MQAQRSTVGKRPLDVIHAVTALVILILLGSDGWVIYRQREQALQGAEANLSNLSVTLAEQADRSFQSLDLVLASVADRIAAQGIGEGETLDSRMGDYETHLLLQEKLSGVPQVDAVTLINPQGKLINFSRFWPIPDVNVSDRDYFKALSQDPSRKTFISAPVQNRGTGSWTIYLARRLDRPGGGFMGLVLGAMNLQYFEDFYQSVALGEGSAISLIRRDGVMLVRYPHSADVGKNFPNGGQRALSYANGIIRDVSPIDRTMRVKSAHLLRNYPLLVLATKTQTSMLVEWWRMTQALAIIGLGGAIGIFVAGLALARWWTQQSSLAQARSDKADAERARALAEAELHRTRQSAAEATSRAKSNFLATMSHEIRTPMNAVLGLASNLLDGDLRPEQREAIVAIQESGDNLLRLLNDILDFSKLEAGRVELEALPFSPERLVHAMVSTVGPRAAAKTLRLDAEFAPDLPPALVGDAGRIRQVLLNLVGNAVKFTEVGEVAIGLRCVARDAARATLEWSVRDTGIGIAAERVDTLFADFAQADSSITRRFGGTGLGLAISKRLIEQMEGMIEVRSNESGGTTFRFRLSLPVAPAVAATTRERGRPVGADLEARIAALGRRLRVLIAEDNLTNQFVAVSLLKDFDIEPTVVGNGIEAVAAVERMSFDLVFMDVRMPEMDGLQATRAIRASMGCFAHLPIVGLTANAFAEDVAACRAAGMQDVIAKPVRKTVFIGAILRALQGEASTDAAAAPDVAA